MKKNLPLFFNEGIAKLAADLTGAEHIYLGIRPYGFHAGNQTALLAYPYLLCKELLKNGKEPTFNFYLFVNDWEQDGLAGPDPIKYPFNIHPRHTTFQYTSDPDGCCENIVDHWQPVIEKKILELKKDFPSVNVISVRNSEMKHLPVFKEILLKTIRNNDKVLDILKKFSNHPTLKSPCMFASIVCPDCKAANGETTINKDDILFNKCLKCGSLSQGQYEDFDYWFYHKTLALPRIAIFNIDLCITGSDHYKEGDFLVRKELLKFFSNKTKLPLTLYSPVVIAGDGRTMGKSRGNTKDINHQSLIKLLEENPNQATIVIE